MFDVMLVDDSSMDLILLTDIVESNIPFVNSIDVFLDSEKAYQQCKTHQYSLVITDIEMPGIDGFELIQRLKEMSNQTIIAVSGSHVADNANETILYAANCYGADHTISKQTLYNSLSALLTKLYKKQPH